MVPVPAVSGQARCFNTEYGAYLSRAHFGNQVLESRPLYLARAGTAQIFVDDLDLLEAKLARVVGEARATASSRCLSSGNIIGSLLQNSSSSVLYPASSLALFVLSRCTALKEALPHGEFECKLSSTVRSSESAAIEVRGTPITKAELFAPSAIHDGNAPMVPSGNSQKRCSPRGNFTLR